MNLRFTGTIRDFGRGPVAEFQSDLDMTSESNGRVFHYGAKSIETTLQNLRRTPTKPLQRFESELKEAQRALLKVSESGR